MLLFARYLVPDVMTLSNSQLRWRKMIGTLIPLIIQLGFVVYVITWASGSGSGRGLLALGVIFVMVLAIPVTYVANRWVISEKQHWAFPWVLMVTVAQSVVVPAGIAFSFVG